MPIFTYTFTVKAPLSAVSAFHHDTRILKKLTPPPLWVQIHQFEPLSDGAKAEFTLWFGPIPVRWTAVHSDVGPHGFTDTQLRGPLKAWRHTHRFTAVTPSPDTQAALTRVQETIQYEHHTGWRGLFSRLLFGRPALYLLFTARKLLTRWHVGQARQPTPGGRRDA
jgi:ligand-binding SRPBCC domain-containing protein